MACREERNAVANRTAGALFLAMLLLLRPGRILLGADQKPNAASPLSERVRHLCDKYVQGFGSPTTELVYHHRLNGPRGTAVLSTPEEIAAGKVGGREMPYGYGSGIQDVPLENGQFLFALCEAYERRPTPWMAAMAQRLFRGFRRIATVSVDPGFVPRGPHPDGKSYYRDSSRDQHMAFVEALWRFGRSPLATSDDRRFIAHKLEQVARRMERNQWAIQVEDGTRQAHVGFSWRQHTAIGAVTLLSFLAMVGDATGNAHWRDLYRDFSAEKDAVRWRKCLAPAAADAWPPLTLYSNQFAQSLAALEPLEPDAARRQSLRDLLRRVADRGLRGNVFDPQCWRRLDWAGDWSDRVTEEALQPFGLSLRRPATVLDVYRGFRIEQWKLGGPTAPTVSRKLCFGIPTSAFHTVMLSADRALLAEIAASVENMVDQMLGGGDLYDRGENFNRAVILGLMLLSDRAKPT
jgi:hypothetical protein